jgi:iron complex transport system substrate-binding protein
MKIRMFAATAAAVLGASALSACSTGSAADPKDVQDAASAVDANAFPVSLKHVYGTTEIKDEPKRVVTIGWAEHDFVLALGVVPVGASKISWGGEENGSTEWFDAELEDLDAEAPTRIDDADGIDVDAIAALDPDLVLATGWDMSKEQYEQLSKVADVVPYETAPYTATWEQSLETIGKALGRTKAAEEVAEETDAALAAVAEENPDLKGKTFLFGGISTTDPSKIDYLTEYDARSGVLTSIGMEVAPSVVAISKGSKEFYGSVSAERADELTSDFAIFIPYEDTTLEDFTALVEGDALLKRVPAVAAGRWFTEVNPRKMLALSAPTPLSLPYAIDTTVGDIVKAVTAK